METPGDADKHSSASAASKRRGAGETLVKTGIFGSEDRERSYRILEEERGNLEERPWLTDHSGASGEEEGSKVNG